MTARRPAALIFIWITVMLDMLAIGPIAPVLPRLVADEQSRLQGATSSLQGVAGLAGVAARLSGVVPTPGIEPGTY